ncbi:hypothetical protein UMM65_01985 [Aureibaculum sp. 2210JD6-5]|uniref:hypothetical protein n=1 Tax=Aureibaculum sp. 2210JD6-5 TaxID=3103957 RepID=UPI002AAC508C|nr:hypothetical protein [Aureibaculum sp. 2210JD6-5]MDY7393998.1 hypothetical protein [Aureibaculum sp. 2210JD6-5]
MRHIFSIIALTLALVSCGNKVEKEAVAKPTIPVFKNGKIASISGNRQISGIYPHLTTYSHANEEGVYEKGLECGIGAVVEWAGKAYMINYAAHEPKGSGHKLYIIDDDLNMEIFEGSIGGTPAARLVHQESNQLFIGPYVIDAKGNIKTIPYSKMEGRLTAIARHLKDPENKVYYYDMEGMLYEVNVHTLEVNKLYDDPLPGWHGKGGYTSQGRLVVSNNGENTSNDKWEESWKIEKSADVICEDCKGVLAEYDGEKFKIVERRQYTDVTTKNGIYAIPNDDSPLWAMGWDKKSVRLKVLDLGVWYTYLIPKATYNNDPAHGWFTEWPRIRVISEDMMMMDMHGMFFEFPSTFSSTNTSGIKPIGSHLRYIPDFMGWKGKVVLATDETSIQGNPLAGQPQSNLWFGDFEELKQWGPATAYGSIWLNEKTKAGEASDAFLVNGFDNKMLHLKNHDASAVQVTIEIDKKGNGKWSKLISIDISENGYEGYVFDNANAIQWVRLKASNNNTLTASFHLTDKDYRSPEDGIKLFEGIANSDYSDEVLHSKLYSNKTNYNLSVFAGNVANNKFKVESEYEFTKYDFTFKNGIKDSTAQAALKTKDIWAEDDASIILNAKNYRLRLPKSPGFVAASAPSGVVRSVREVESERELANIGGTFYELPLYYIGIEPLYKMMRPVATHNKQISDFNTWNGLLVLSGVKKNAPKSEHVYKSEDNNVGLWFGGIDDLWKLGKPRGEGGPWKNTNVKAAELSDPYLMTGYDKKTLKLVVDKDMEVELYIHISHYTNEPVLYKTFSLKANEAFNYEFPEGFSAHWIQFKANRDCNATAWLSYS